MAADVKKIADALENIHKTLKELEKWLKGGHIRVIEGY
jgi:hypothetical protein